MDLEYNEHYVKSVKTFFANEQNRTEFVKSSAYELLVNHRHYAWYADAIANRSLYANDFHYFLICRCMQYFEHFNREYEMTNKKFIAYDEVMFDLFHEKETFKRFYDSHSHDLPLHYVLATHALPYDEKNVYQINAMRCNKRYAHIILQDYYFYVLFCNEYKETQQNILANIHETCKNDFAMSIGERVFADERIVSIVARFL